MASGRGCRSEEVTSRGSVFASFGDAGGTSGPSERRFSQVARLPSRLNNNKLAEGKEGADTYPREQKGSAYGTFSPAPIRDPREEVRRGGAVAAATAAAAVVVVVFPTFVPGIPGLG